jgi:hypothetical protein
MARTLIGEVEIRLRDSLTPGAQKAADALRAVKGAADSLGSGAKLDALSSGLKDATANAQALAKAMEGAKWGSSFTQQLSKMRISPEEIARLRNEFRALQEKTAGMSTRERRDAIAAWKAQALGAINDVRAAERALSREAIEAAKARAVQEKQQAKEVAQEKARIARETAQQAIRSAADARRAAREADAEAKRLARANEREEARAAREASKASRDARREEEKAARTAAQTARENAREARREEARTAREAAQAAREVAREKALAARTAVQEAREARREEVRAAREAVQAQRAAAREVREARQPFLRGAGMVASGIGMAAGVSSGASAVSQGARFAMNAAAEASSVRTQMRLAGMTPDEISQIEARSGELSQRYRTLNIPQLMQLGQSLRSSTGSVPKALEMLETFAQMSSVLTAVRGSHDPQRDLEQFGKAMDVLGATENVPLFRSAAEAALRAAAVERRDMPLGEFLTFARRSKGTAQQLVGGDFWNNYLPNLIQQAGGNSVGTSWHSLISQLIGGRGTARARQVRADSGLAGANGGIIDPALLATEPHRWAQQHMVPALNREFRRAGVLERNADGSERQFAWGQEMTPAQTTAMMQFFSRAFSHGKAGEFFSIMMGQSSQMEKAAEMYRSSPGVTAAQGLTETDLRSAGTSVVEQTRNLVQQLMEPITGPLTGGLNSLGEAISKLTTSAKGWTDVEKMAAAVGTLAAAGAAGLATIVASAKAAQTFLGRGGATAVTAAATAAAATGSGAGAAAAGAGRAGLMRFVPGVGFVVGAGIAAYETGDRIAEFYKGVQDGEIHNAGRNIQREARRRQRAERDARFGPLGESQAGGGFGSTAGGDFQSSGPQPPPSPNALPAPLGAPTNAPRESSAPEPPASPNIRGDAQAPAASVDQQVDGNTRAAAERLGQAVPSGVAAAEAAAAAAGASLGRTIAENARRGTPDRGAEPFMPPAVDPAPSRQPTDIRSRASQPDLTEPAPESASVVDLFRGAFARAEQAAQSMAARLDEIRRPGFGIDVGAGAPRPAIGVATDGTVTPRSSNAPADALEQSLSAVEQKAAGVGERVGAGVASGLSSAEAEARAAAERLGQSVPAGVAAAEAAAAAAGTAIGNAIANAARAAGAAGGGGGGGNSGGGGEGGGGAPSPASPPGRAMGGPVTAGRLYTVVENGDEIFAPGANGSIIPNHALGSIGGRSSRAVVNMGGVTITGGNAEEIMAKLSDTIRNAMAGAFSDSELAGG